MQDIMVKGRFTGSLLKAIHLADAPPRGLRVLFGAPPDESDIRTYVVAELDARYAELDKFFGLKSNSPNIWELRSKELLAHKFNIPVDALQSWEHLTRYLTGRYVPGFALKGPTQKKRGAPLEWDFKQFAWLFADIEFLKKSTGMSVRKICNALPTREGYAKRWGRYRGRSGGEGLRKAYAEAKKLFSQNLEFKLQACGSDALTPAKCIDLIEAAIRGHALQL